MATGHSSRPGSTPTAGDFEFGTLAIPLTLLCQSLSDETLKAVGGRFFGIRFVADGTFWIFIHP